MNNAISFSKFISYFICIGLHNCAWFEKQQNTDYDLSSNTDRLWSEGISCAEISDDELYKNIGNDDWIKKYIGQIGLEKLRKNPDKPVYYGVPDEIFDKIIFHNTCANVLESAKSITEFRVK